MTENQQQYFPMQRSNAGLPMSMTDPSAVAAAEAAKARIQAAYTMALQKPRNEMEARDRILTACKRSEFAGRAEYSKPIGKTKVTGPSIRFAELALREWGNILTETQMLYEDDNVRRLRVSVLDLETNAQFTKDIQIKRTVERRSSKGREDDVISERKNTFGDTVYILRATDEEMYTKEASWVSRVLRNEGLRVIPTDIIEEGMQTARATVSNRAFQDPAGEQKKLVDAFSSIGVKPKDLEKYLDHAISQTSPAELIDLRVVYQSIRDGEAKWSDYVHAAAGGSSYADAAPGAEQTQTGRQPEKPDISAFESLVSAQTGKPWKFDPAGTDDISKFVLMSAQGQDPPVSPHAIMASIGQKNFAGFWGACTRYAESQKKQGPAAGVDPGQGSAGPASSNGGNTGQQAQVQDSGPGRDDEPPPADPPDNNANPFDMVESKGNGWQGNGLREKGTRQYWADYGHLFNDASPKAKEGFRSKWARTVKNEPFPGDAHAQASDAGAGGASTGTEQQQGHGNEQDGPGDEPGDLFEGDQGGGIEDPPFGGDQGGEEPGGNGDACVADDLKAQFDELCRDNPDLYGKFSQLWPTPKTEGELEQAINWISSMAQRRT